MRPLRRRAAGRLAPDATQADRPGARRAAGAGCRLGSLRHRGDGEEHGALAARIDAEGLAPRVRLLGRVSDAELIDRLATCRAVCFPPAREDYGLVTVEAFASGKPVITCTDSGGPAELVEAGVNGCVVEPNAPALAEAMARLMEDAGLAERMGAAARERAAAMTWDRALDRLLLV